MRGVGSPRELRSYHQTGYDREIAETARGRFDSGDICIFCPRRFSREDLDAANCGQCNAMLKLNRYYGRI
jgi:hypothetical protein